LFNFRKYPKPINCITIVAPKRVNNANAQLGILADLVTGLSEMAVPLPFRAPIIEVIIDSTNPPHIGIHIDMPIQKPGSAMEAIITNALLISRTYQKLLGFFLTMK
jgi:hypothetical protein